MFDSLLNELHISIREHGGNPIDLPPDFREYYSKKKQAKIMNWLWDVPGFRRWRVTRLDAGKNLQVLNSVAYPNYNKDKPLLGIDFLWFAKRNKLVAVLDFQPLIQDQNYFDKYFSDFKLLKDRFPHFNDNQNMFSYDPNRYFSPWVLFCRGGVDEYNQSLPLIFSLFMNCYWGLDTDNDKNSFKINHNEVEKLQANYDIYGSEKDPAHGLFVSFFGQEWSDRFMKEFLFPLSQKI